MADDPGGLDAGLRLSDGGAQAVTVGVTDLEIEGDRSLPGLDDAQGRGGHEEHGRVQGDARRWGAGPQDQSRPGEGLLEELACVHADGLPLRRDLEEGGGREDAGVHGQAYGHPAVRYHSHEAAEKENAQC